MLEGQGHNRGVPVARQPVALPTARRGCRAQTGPRGQPHGTSEGLRRMRTDLGQDGVSRRAADAGDRLQPVQFVPTGLKGALHTLVQILDALLDSVMVVPQSGQAPDGVCV